jgi:hypothetical protein
MGVLFQVLDSRSLAAGPMGIKQCKKRRSKVAKMSIVTLPFGLNSDLLGMSTLAKGTVYTSLSGFREAQEEVPQADRMMY